MVELVLSKEPRTLKRIGGKPKLYLISIIINSPLEESDMIDLTTSFVNGIPHTDMTFNLQYADHSKISKNNRGASING